LKTSGLGLGLVLAGLGLGFDTVGLVNITGKCDLQSFFLLLSSFPARCLALYKVVIHCRFIQLDFTAFTVMFSRENAYTSLEPCALWVVQELAYNNIIMMLILNIKILYVFLCFCHYMATLNCVWLFALNNILLLWVYIRYRLSVLILTFLRRSLIVSDIGTEIFWNYLLKINTLRATPSQLPICEWRTGSLF